MGVRSIEAFNLALMGKNAWRMVSNPQCLLAQMYIAKYKKYAIECASRGHVMKGISYGFRGLCRAASAVECGWSRRIGNGEETDIVKDH